MDFVETPLAGAYVVDIQTRTDERGFFARTFCSDEFSERGLCHEFPQCNLSFNEKTGTLRGMHFQREPFGEAKLVRCTAGTIYDVMVDLRRDSLQFRRWFGVELNSDNRRAVYVPSGFAHGFVTLTPSAEVFYQMSERHRPDLATGVRWNDPAFGIVWPVSRPIISERDAKFPDFF